MAIKHAFTNPNADDADTTITRPSDWNANHVIDDSTITYAKIQNVSATDKLLGRATAGAGVVEEIACTAAGRALLDDADAAAQRTTLDLAAIAASGSGADLGAGTVALDRIANLTALRVVGSIAGGVPAEVTAPQVLDFIAAGNGAVLGRYGGTWAALGRVTTDGDDLVLANVATPAAPAASSSKLVAAPFAGRQLLGSLGADGVVHTMGPSIARSTILAAMPVPGANNHTVLGTAGWTFSGTATARSIAAGDNVTCIGRLGLVSAAGAGSLAGMRLAVLRLHRGDAAGRGGFHSTWHWAITDPVLVTDARMFCGLWGSSGAPTNVEPSSLTQLVGIGCDAGDTTLQVYGAAGTAQARADLGANFPVNTTSTDLYEISLYAPPNGAYVGWQVTRRNTGHVATGTITDSAALPTNTQFLAPHLWRTNNATAAVCSLDWWGTVIEPLG